MNDIPEALRDGAKSKSSLRRKKHSLLGLRLAVLGVAIIGGLVSLAFWLYPRLNSPNPPTPQPVASSTPSPSEESTKIVNVLGHLPYPEAPQSELKAITSEGRIRLRKPAANKFKAMQAAARENGVILTPISGFRSVKEQEYLFFGVKAERNQEAKKRAEVSAPPGYSEHHTGYAVDIGDGKAPTTNLHQNFEKTAAFRWLKDNAARYNFELSFPPNNPQGVSYEPWHWRYVGDTDSLETFYKAEQLKKPSSSLEKTDSKSP